MKPDLLRQATQALRQQTHGDSDRAAETRRQMLASLRSTGRVSKLQRLRWMLPIAAVLVVSSAWAASQGNASDGFRWALETIGPTQPATKALSVPQRGQQLDNRNGCMSSMKWSKNAAPAIEPQTMASSVGASSEGASVVSTAAASASVVPSIALLQRSSSAPAPRPHRMIRAAPVASAPSSVVAPKVDDSEDPKVQALYAAAHQKHFTDHDPAGALAGWDAYLQAAPRGRFATEARYNRALCLARLGRSSEATAALSSFANASPGAYRQAEARALVEALDAP